MPTGRSAVVNVPRVAVRFCPSRGGGAGGGTLIRARGGAGGGTLIRARGGAGGGELIRARGGAGGGELIRARGGAAEAIAGIPSIVAFWFASFTPQYLQRTARDGSSRWHAGQFLVLLMATRF
jgi:hypothetical protein